MTIMNRHFDKMANGSTGGEKRPSWVKSFGNRLLIGSGIAETPLANPEFRRGVRDGAVKAVKHVSNATGFSETPAASPEFWRGVRNFFVGVANATGFSETPLGVLIFPPKKNEP